MSVCPREGGVCVCVSTGGIPYDHYPWCIGLHCTGTPTPVLPSSRHPQPPPPLNMGLGTSRPAMATPNHDPPASDT